MSTRTWRPCSPPSPALPHGTLKHWKGQELIVGGSGDGLKLEDDRLTDVDVEAGLVSERALFLLVRFSIGALPTLGLDRPSSLGIGRGLLLLAVTLVPSGVSVGAYVGN